MLAKCVLRIQEFNWNQRVRGKKIKLNICHHMLTSSTKLQNRSFHDVERTRTHKCASKACKTIIFHCQICKFLGHSNPKQSQRTHLFYLQSSCEWEFFVQYCLECQGHLQCTSVRKQTKGEFNDKLKGSGPKRPN